MRRTALIGFHDPTYLDELASTLRGLGYDKVTSVSTPVDMIRYAENGGYDTCLMDVNLGSPGSDVYIPAEQVFGLVGPTSRHFFAFSANRTAVMGANDAGIPCKPKTKIFDVLEIISSDV
ncbi:MAG: hypothetical protein GF368_04715 [Candidatus Aenigmarchaeota archaeon]|nr:hypothetical protein [Candidatus Aenigmarchaeota archaeon]